MMHPALLATACLVATSTLLPAQFAPGDISRDYVWRPNEKWQRVTGPDAIHDGAKQFLPNPVNEITIDDLALATRIEVIVEKMTSHAGTNNARLRVNGNAWIPIAEPPESQVPGARGSGLPTIMYLMLRYPSVPVPLAQFVQGKNTFELTCQGAGGADLGAVWPQWLVYGVTFRVFYQASKPHPMGRIRTPVSGAELTGDTVFEAEVTGGNVQRVDFIGNYDDFDWRGEGATRPWQYSLRYGELLNHIGSATGAPWRVTWSTAWIPTQNEPFEVLARLVDQSGLTFVTPLARYTLRRSQTVVRHQAYNIPKRWQTRNTIIHDCNVDVTGDLGKARAAKAFFTNWNGVQAEGIGFNYGYIAQSVGKLYDTSYDQLDVPVGQIVQGRNLLRTRSSTPEHGIDVEWPGIELFIRFDLPEERAQLVLYGDGCRGSNGMVGLGHTGRPVLGQPMSLDLSGARALSVGVLMIGASNSKFGAVDLPFDFTPLGAPGCQMLASLDLLGALVTDAQGKATVGFSVPSRTDLLGVLFFNQFIVLDAPANQMGATFSNGGRATVGR